MMKINASTLKRLFTLEFWNTSAVKSGEVYNSIDELPLYNFIKVLTTEDLKWLIKSGTPTELDQAWENIFSEYSESISDGKPSRELILVVQISYLENRLPQIYMLARYLSKRRSDILIDVLKNTYGFKLPFTDLSKDLPRVLTLCKTDEVKLKKLRDEYSKLSKSEVKTTESDFSSNLVSLSKYLGYMPNKREISVSEYIEMLKDFKRNNTPK